MRSLAASDFPQFFRAVNEGREPFPWQVALAERVIREGKWPTSLDLPTGSGKTSVLEVALFHLAVEAEQGEGRRAPVRIVFVVDRKLIVDQTEKQAMRIRKLLKMDPDPVVREVADRLVRLGGTAKRPLVVEKLRGGIPVPTDWARTPSQPTVLLSTVDQVGSRLLFRGYGVSNSMKPLQAGLLGGDALIFLDEAHLSEPFRQTLEWVDRYRQWGNPMAPWQHVTLTATPHGAPEQTFGLSEADRSCEILARRLNASKPAELLEAASTEIFVERAMAWANAGVPRVLVVVNRVDMARDIFERLKSDEFERVLLIGRSREIDRRQIVERYGAKLVSNAAELERPIVVVATQCIEAGADFDFDALVTQLAPLDALRQRFGRLNRMGRPIEAQAVIIALREDLKAKVPDPIYGERAIRTWEWLSEQATEAGKKRTVDFGVEAMAERLAANAEKVRHCVSDKGMAPVMPPAYVDLWNMTSPVPDPDPEVAIFLHGVETGPADVEIVWRADLGEVSVGRREALRAIVGAMPPRPAEALAIPLRKARAWLAGDARGRSRAGDVSEVEGTADEEDEREPQMRAVLRWRGEDSDETQVLEGRASGLRPGDVLVVPADYGGCDEWGWAPASERWVRDVADEAAEPFFAKRNAVRIHPRLGFGGATLERAFEAGETGRAEEVLQRLKEVDSWPELIGRAVQMMVQATEVRRYDDEPRAFILVGRGKRPSFSTENDRNSSLGDEMQLAKHQAAVMAQTEQFAVAAGLPERVGLALKVAAEWHDAGKGDRRFQAYLRNALPDGPVLAKSPRGYYSLAADRKIRIAWRLPAGWRHEALSVRMAAPEVENREDLDPELVLWLVGTHHGHGRPFFAFEDPLGSVEREVLLADGQSCRLREGVGPERLDFEWRGMDWAGLGKRLRERYGTWELARLESVLRLADHRASEGEASEQEDDDE